MSCNGFPITSSSFQPRILEATDNPTIADIANYTYIAHAPEGDVSLEAYPHVIAWLRRVEEITGFVAMQKKDVGLAA
ncbi:MAG: hypothetical protein KUG50_03350 [Cycloclasticus sp.]|nr:hypothetical protein [Cycloclasticus sp.]